MTNNKGRGRKGSRRSKSSSSNSAINNRKPGSYKPRKKTGKKFSEDSDKKVNPITIKNTSEKIIKRCSKRHLMLMH